MKAGGFWSHGVTAFFDARVSHVNPKTNQGKPTAAIFKEQEIEKKRKYQQILKSVNTSISGSRQPFFRSEVVDDFKVNCIAADLLS